MNKTLLKYLLPLFLTPVIAYSQLIDSTKMSVADVMIFHSNILQEDRKIYIYKPTDDTTYLPQAYPVLYLMDGEEQMAMVTGQVNYLSKIFNIIPPMIVVGIGNNDRTKDLTPTHSTSGNNGKADTSLAAALQTSGNGEKFLQFLREELMPYIEQHYRTTAFKAFCGHSLGGLMAVYTLLTHSNMFTAYIAISPSLWWDQQYVLKQAKRWQPDFSNKKFLFLSDGSEGGPFHKDATHLDALLKAKKSGNLNVEYVYYPKEPHAAEPVKATYDALRFIYNPIYPPEFDSLSSFIYFKPEWIIRYYKQISIQKGYDVKPSEAVVDRLAHYLLSLKNLKNTEDALELFLLNVSNYPTSWHAYSSLGDVYLQRKNTELAIKNYNKGLELKPDNKSIQEKIKRLQ